MPADQVFDPTVTIRFDADLVAHYKQVYAAFKRT